MLSLLKALNMVFGKHTIEYKQDLKHKRNIVSTLSTHNKVKLNPVNSPAVPAAFHTLSVQLGTCKLSRNGSL